MPRLVEPQPPGARFAAREGGAGGGANDYAERVAKYIPGEVLAAYLSVNGILASVSEGEASLSRTAYVATFLLFLGLTPVYLAKASPAVHPKRVQLAVSTVAFLVWAYSLGGVFAAFGVYVPWIGAILLICFTAVSGAIVPTAPGASTPAASTPGAPAPSGPPPVQQPPH